MKMVDLVNDGQMVSIWFLRKMTPLPLYGGGVYST